MATHSYLSGAAISKNRIVYVSAANTVTQVTDADGAGQDFAGVAERAASAAGEVITVAMQGEITYITAGATITPGTDLWLSSNDSGQAIPGSGTARIIGQFMGDRTVASGELARVLINPRRLY